MIVRDGSPSVTLESGRLLYGTYQAEPSKDGFAMAAFPGLGNVEISGMLFECIPEIDASEEEPAAVAKRPAASMSKKAAAAKGRPFSAAWRAVPDHADVGSDDQMEEGCCWRLLLRCGRGCELLLLAAGCCCSCYSCFSCCLSLIHI